MGMWGELQEGQTLSCVHCQFTWVLVKGSGRKRGFCTKCMGYTCGKRECETACVPAERRIENLEAGRSELTPTPPLIVVPSRVEVLTSGG